MRRSDPSPDGDDSGSVPGEAAGEQRFLGALGQRVRALRTDRGLSRRRLAEHAGVSQRYLAQLEGGQGNVSVRLLRRIALALSTQPAELLPPATAHPMGVALIGLRGAGKSTLGRRAADELELPFVELNERVAVASGLGTEEIFNLYGAEGFRRFELGCLEALIAAARPVVLATGGGIVEKPETLSLLLANFLVVWVRARPQEHMQRVQEQGDTRPMSGHQHAMDALQRILDGRAALYARAHCQLDTSGRRVENCAGDLVHLLRDAGF